MKPHSILLCSFLVVHAYNCSAQQTVVRSPFVLGNSGQLIPFDLGQTTLSSTRYQQVYGATDFLTVMPQGGMITALRFDVALRENGGGPFRETLPSLQINLSTTARPVDGLSMLFVDNIGANDTVVFGIGSITLADFSTGGADIIIPLATPFFYDPNAGNLLLDVRNFAGGTTSPFSGNHVFGDSTSSLFSDSVEDDSGLRTTSGLVTVFNVVPVPEPGTWSLFLLGLAAILWATRGRRQRT